MATRRRAFGNIRPAGKSSWQASYKVNGQRFIAPSTFPSKADASAWLANIQADINRGIWIDPTAGKESLAQYVAGWLERKQKTGHYRPRTLELVTGLLDRIVLPALGDRGAGGDQDSARPLVARRCCSKTLAGAGGEVLPAPPDDPRRGHLGRDNPFQPLRDQGCRQRACFRTTKAHVGDDRRCGRQPQRPLLPPQPQAQ